MDRHLHGKEFMSVEVKGVVLGLLALFSALGIAVGLSPLLQPKRDPNPNSAVQAGKPLSVSSPVLTDEAKRGHELFDRNCAHCHGDDARGDEGPDLHNLKKSDARIRSIIKGGIKGEMPSLPKS